MHTENFSQDEKDELISILKQAAEDSMLISFEKWTDLFRGFYWACHVFSLYNGRDDKYSDMHCPNCSAQMQLMQRYEVDIDYCPSCKGVWLDRGEIDKIAKIQRSYEDQHYNKYHYREGGYDDYYDDYYQDNRSRNRGFFGSLFDM